MSVIRGRKYTLSCHVRPTPVMFWSSDCLKLSRRVSFRGDFAGDLAGDFAGNFAGDLGDLAGEPFWSSFACFFGPSDIRIYCAEQW